MFQDMVSGSFLNEGCPIPPIHFRSKVAWVKSHIGGSWAFLAIRILAIVVMIRPDWTFLLKTDFLIAFLALLVGKRMRDFGVSAVWGWVGVAVISVILPIVTLIVWPNPRDAADPLDIVSPLVGLLIFALLLGLIVWVGLKKDDAAPTGSATSRSSRCNPTARGKWSTVKDRMGFARCGLCSCTRSAICALLSGAEHVGGGCHLIFTLCHPCMVP